MDSQHTLDESTLDELTDRLRGGVIGPDDAEYDDARAVWNGRFDEYPAAVARCAGTTDVMAAVEFAGEHDLPVAVRGGGHSYAGNGTRDGALVIDLGRLDSVRVDPDAGVARVGPGATWADLDHETQAFGLATTGATVSTVGVAGYTLGGGTGHLARTHGLACDNLLAADVVTADGELVHASAEENPDLFWALRGGSGNVGIVTSFAFELHEVGPELLAGQIIHGYEDGPEVLRAYRSFMAEAPDRVNCYAFVVPIPPLEVFPPERHGEPGIDLVASYDGPIEEGEAALEPLRAIGDPLFDGVRPQSYTELQQAFDEGVPSGERWYSKAQYLDGLPDGALDTVVEYTENLPGPMTMVYFEPMGGAVNAVDADATAFPHRDADFGIHILPGWSDPEKDEEIMNWADEFHMEMSAYSADGVYVNLLDRAEGDRIDEAYGSNLERLRAVKAEWDPENRFDTNHNVEPGD